MGLFENEMILPGVITEIVSDYSYGYDTSKFGTTDSITIIGTAFNGPVGRPTEVYSPEHAKYIFGNTYDYKTKREATLVAEVLDAWDRGCRTIYAIRVSGKPMHKDFQLATESNHKLRISGIFPSNENKNVYMVYDDTLGNSKLKLYKPSRRATIKEKLEGFVEQEEDILVHTLDLSNSYGLTREDSLTELIRVCNEHGYNNVLTLSIVDNEGNDVTYTSTEAKSIPIGAMFPGAYFIGRDKNKAHATTDLSYVFTSETEKPFESFTETVFKKLKLNTDVNQDLPIYGNIADLNSKFQKAGVGMSDMWDFLEVPGKIDAVFGKDRIDYEEVGISDFDLYKKLGSGFAITASVDPNKENRVRETPVADSNRVMPIQDGIYSMLENLKSDYRVLTNGDADTVIQSKIPRKKDFEISNANEIKALNGKIIAKAKINKDDIFDPKKYKFVFDEIEVDEDYTDEIREKLYTKTIIQKVSKVDDIKTLKDSKKNFAVGSLFLDIATKTLNRFEDGKFTSLESINLNSELEGRLVVAGEVIYKGVKGSTIEFEEVDTLTEFDSKEYVLVGSAGTISVHELGVEKLTPIGNIDDLFSEENDKTLVTVQSEYIEDNIITINSEVFDYTTLEEFVEILNANKSLNKLFTFTIEKEALTMKDFYILDIAGEGIVKSFPVGKLDSATNDSNITVDTNLYIPYKTTDTFARHLAQHCTYTSLKTAPTHGIIGCSKMLDVSLDSIVKKVDKLSKTDFNLYAKKPNGKDMLDKNNFPYPIGKNISVVAGQYIVNSGDGYNYISNGAAGYAGMVSILPLDQSSTSQPISIPTPMYEYTNYQLGRLTKKGLVTFKQSYSMGFVVTDGITMAPAASPFSRLSVSRITSKLEEVIRAAVEPFIGKQNHLANRNSMQTAIKSELEKLKGRLIEAFEFNFVLDPSSQKLGIVNIDYVIVPIYEIREVRNSISI